MLSSILWFVVVVAMIPLALWLLKRSPAGARFGAAAVPGAMRHVAALQLSANQRVVTIEVGTSEDRRWLVLGVTPHSITPLHTMAPQAELPPPGAALAPSFAQVFGRLRHRGADGSTT